MFKLIDTFNNVLISTHKSLAAAVAADMKHDRAVKRANGSASYIPTAILENGEPVDDNELMAERERQYFAR